MYVIYLIKDKSNFRGFFKGNNICDCAVLFLKKSITPLKFDNVEHKRFVVICGLNHAVHKCNS